MMEIKEVVNIESMIYEMRGVFVILDSEISVTKCNGRIITCYDIRNSISAYNYNFADTSAKLERGFKNG